MPDGPASHLQERLKGVGQLGEEVLLQERRRQHWSTLVADVLAQQHGMRIQAFFDGSGQEPRLKSASCASSLQQLYGVFRVCADDVEEVLVSVPPVPGDFGGGIPLSRHPDHVAA
ncbi:MAG TPA: hypothetical protein VMO47_00810 [Rhodothermales bacterium]|nr:hypothetical protein [Rhodothermales bacterium]